MKFNCYEDYKKEMENLKNSILDTGKNEYFEMMDKLSIENFEFSIKFDDENRQSNFLKKKKK